MTLKLVRALVEELRRHFLLMVHGARHHDKPVKTVPNL